MKKRTLALIALLLALLTLFSACQPATTTPDPTPTPAAATPTVVPTPTPPAERVVTDMAGREVTLPAEIDSIATFGSIGVLNAFVGMMGEADKICSNMSPRFQKGRNAPMQYKFAPQMKDLPIFEDSEILIEEVLRVKPDLCLTMTLDTAEFLEQNGLACIYLEWKELTDVPIAVNLMGEALNKPERAQQYLEYFDTSIAKAADLVKAIPEADKLKVLYGSAKDLSQPHIIAEWWIAQAGGISVTDNGRTDESLSYTIEELLLWNPDVMFLSGDQAAELKADKRYGKIAAVANDKMYLIPAVAHSWGNRTVEQPLTIFWAMSKLYPELMTPEAFKEEVRTFYRTFFNYEMTDEDIATYIG